MAICMSERVTWPGPENTMPGELATTLTTVSGPLPDSWRAFVVMPTLVMCHWPGASCVQPFAMMLALIAVVSAAPVTSPDGCSRTAAPPPPALPHADASPDPVATGTCPAEGVPDGSG